MISEQVIGKLFHWLEGRNSCPGCLLPGSQFELAERIKRLQLFAGFGGSEARVPDDLAQ